MLLIKRIIVYFLLIIMLILTGCENLSTQSIGKTVHLAKTGQLSLNKKRKFTRSQLSTYNGKNGCPAYIAVKGMVYDVTHAPDWHNGNHHGVQAGQDLTAAIEHSPHGASVLAAVPIVGYLVNERPTATKQKSNGTTSPSKQSDKRTFTLAELKKYNGQNGQPAYVAVKGKVYDVTHAPGWHNGYHHGVQAGQDLTTAIEHAPHGTSVLSSLTVIGYLK